jgi:hypothetical protein
MEETKVIKYNEELNKLFDTWQKASGTREARDFHCDGLMHKGDFR